MGRRVQLEKRDEGAQGGANTYGAFRAPARHGSPLHASRFIAMPSSDSELSCAPPGSFPALQSPQAPPSQSASLRRKRSPVEPEELSYPSSDVESTPQPSSSRPKTPQTGPGRPASRNNTSPLGEPSIIGRGSSRSSSFGQGHSSKPAIINYALVVLGVLLLATGAILVSKIGPMSHDSSIAGAAEAKALEAKLTDLSSTVNDLRRYLDERNRGGTYDES